MRDAEKNRWGEKLRDAEKAREDEYFAKRERELLRKLRERKPDTDGGKEKGER